MHFKVYATLFFATGLENIVRTLEITMTDTFTGIELKKDAGHHQELLDYQPSNSVSTQQMGLIYDSCTRKHIVVEFTPKA